MKVLDRGIPVLAPTPFICNWCHSTCVAEDGDVVGRRVADNEPLDYEPAVFGLFVKQNFSAAYDYTVECPVCGSENWITIPFGKQTSRIW